MDNKIIKLVTIICLGITLVALIVARNSAAVEYEASIYTATPLFVWFSLLLNLICGISIITHQLSTYNYKRSNIWLLGLVLILFSYILFQALWIIRGYTLYNIGDPAFHLGMIKEVLISGYVDKRSIYPLLYILSVEISTVSGFSIITIHKTLSLIFSLFFVLFIYVFAKTILGKKGQIIIATIAGMAFVLPLTYLNFTPNYLGNFIFPVVLYILIKCYENDLYQWKILLITFIFFLPLLHPVLALALVIIMIAPWISKKSLSVLLNLYVAIKMKINPKSDVSIRSKPIESVKRIKIIGVYMSAILLLFVWTITWVSSFFQWNVFVLNTYKIITEGSTNELDLVKDAINYGASLGYNPFVHFFKLYGDLILFLFLSIIGLFLLIRSTSLSKKQLRGFFYLYSSMLIVCMLTGLFFLLNLGFGNDRLFVYLILLSIPIVGYVLHQFLQKAINNPNKIINRKTGSILLVILLMGMFIEGGSTIYASSYTHIANWQITKTELDGMDWFFNEKNRDIGTSTFSVVPGRFANILLSSQEHESRNDIPSRFSTGITSKYLQVKYHFGYDNNTYLGQQYIDNFYMVLNKKDREVYQEVLPEMAKIRFLPQDFVKLENDTTVNTIYSNGGLDVYFVNYRQK